VPVRKYCAVYYLAHDSYHGMEEVVGSIPTRSTKSKNSRSCVLREGFVLAEGRAESPSLCELPA